MTRPADPAETPPDPALAARQLAMLGRLAEAGLEIAIALEGRAKAAASAPEDQPVDLDAVALAYARVSRAVRLAILMQSRLVEGRDDHARASAERRAREASAEEHGLWAREEVEKERAVRIVRRVAQAEHDDGDRIERLCAEAAERLEDDDCYGAALARPLSDLVADICRDLGLHPDWARLAEEAWAVEEIRSGDVGEPFSRFASPSMGEGGDGGDASAVAWLQGHPQPRSADDLRQPSSLSHPGRRARPPPS